MNSVENNRIVSIDYTKMIMSVLVLSIHFAPLISFNKVANYWIQNYIARIAVPFFFICNGYFLLYESKHKMKEKFIKQIKYSFDMYIKWSIIYSPIIIYGILKKRNFAYTIPKFIFDFFLSGSYMHLWYLLALAFSLIIIYILKFYFKFDTKHILLMFVGFYAVGVIYNCYHDYIFYQFENVNFINTILKAYDYFFSTTRNALFFGCVYILIGVYIAEIEVEDRRNDLIKLMFFLVGLAFEVLLVWMINGYKLESGPDMYLLLLPVSYYLFRVVVSMKTKKTYKINLCDGKTSVLFYYIHCWVVFIYELVQNKILDLKYMKLYSPISFIIIFMITLIIVYIITTLSTKEKYKWIRKFY